MTRIPTEISWHRRWLLDELVEAYVSWREECSAVWAAYSIWSDAPSGDAADLYATYSTALDREQRASEHYARRVRRVGASIMPDLRSIAGLGARRGASGHEPHRTLKSLVQIKCACRWREGLPPHTPRVPSAVHAARSGFRRSTPRLAQA